MRRSRSSNFTGTTGVVYNLSPPSWSCRNLGFVRFPEKIKKTKNKIQETLPNNFSATHVHTIMGGGGLTTHLLGPLHAPRSARIRADRGGAVGLPSSGRTVGSGTCHLPLGGGGGVWVAGRLEAGEDGT